MKGTSGPGLASLMGMPPISAIAHRSHANSPHKVGQPGWASLETFYPQPPAVIHDPDTLCVLCKGMILVICTAAHLCSCYFYTLKTVVWYKRQLDSIIDERAHCRGDRCSSRSPAHSSPVSRHDTTCSWQSQVS